MKLHTFASWPDVLAHVAAGGAVYYQAPLDYRPILVRAELWRGSEVRVYPPSSDADPFTADLAHLPRFRHAAPGGGSL